MLSHTRHMAVQNFPNTPPGALISSVTLAPTINLRTASNQHLGKGISATDITSVQQSPDQVHYGQADDIHAARQRTLDHAFSNNPERFVTKPPEPPPKPTAVWINPPQNNAEPPSLN